MYPCIMFAFAFALLSVAFFPPLRFTYPPACTHDIHARRPSPTTTGQAQPLATAPPAGLRLQMCGLADAPISAPVTPIMVYAYPHGYMMAYPIAKPPHGQARRQSAHYGQVCCLLCELSCVGFYPSAVRACTDVCGGRDPTCGDWGAIVAELLMGEARCTTGITDSGAVKTAVL